MWRGGFIQVGLEREACSDGVGGFAAAVSGAWKTPFVEVEPGRSTSAPWVLHPRVVVMGNVEKKISILSSKVRPKIL